MMARCGLIMVDGGGGDYYFTVVNNARWRQICELPDDLTVSARSEIIQWLCCDDPEVARPEGAPSPKGLILKKFNNQNHVIEVVHLHNIGGVLTLP